MARNLLAIKSEAMIRKFMCGYLSDALPLFIVTEYPKSGGTWFAQLLSDLLELPFYRNQFPKIGSQVMHGHYRYSPKMRNVFCVMRDGRDVMVSFYYHCLFFREDQLNYHEVKATSRALKIFDSDNIEKNLPRFIEYKFTTKGIPKFSWSAFVKDWVDKNVPLIRYEQMLGCPEKVISNAFQFYSLEMPKAERVTQTLNKYSFEHLSGRKNGDENKVSFLRNGIAGEWKSKFNLEARQVFNYYAGDKLIELGYEQDRNWVDRNS
jgi:Sulfotransferase domain